MPLGRVGRRISSGLQVGEQRAELLWCRGVVEVWDFLDEFFVRLSRGRATKGGRRSVDVKTRGVAVRQRIEAQVEALLRRNLPGVVDIE